MIGDLTRAGVLLRLQGPMDAPLVHVDQVTALARRRDLPALLDRHVLYGPDQAAVRLGLRRTDLDHLLRRTLLTPARTVAVDFGKARGGEVAVDLYRGQDVAVLSALHPDIDWAALHRLPDPGGSIPWHGCGAHATNG
ncbi:hypothetical protein AB0P15_36720 [Streptomyces sp. NPDC087917]|uniref:hypothetical protein n=1 Tax=Streptomyces sp. NPDC087917 TaxID=3155060 RepID=UPI00341BEF07